MILLNLTDPHIEGKLKYYSFIKPHIAPKAKRLCYVQYDDFFYSHACYSNYEIEGFEGLVIWADDHIFIVKINGNTFAGVSKKLAGCIPAVNDKVLIRPYVRRDFNGKRFCRTKHQKGRLSWPFVQIPVQEPEHFALKEMIAHLEWLYAKDCYRRIAEMMVNVNAHAFKVFDPDPGLFPESFPSICFTVILGSYLRRITIYYNTNNSLYELHMAPEGEMDALYVDKISPSQLGSALSEWFDDGIWKILSVYVVP